jgi:hypothetical protein
VCQQSLPKQSTNERLPFATKVWLNPFSKNGFGSLPKLAFFVSFGSDIHLNLRLVLLWQWQ